MDLIPNTFKNHAYANPKALLRCAHACPSICDAPDTEGIQEEKKRSKKKSRGPVHLLQPLVKHRHDLTLN
jgi:hypothetical protein